MPAAMDEAFGPPGSMTVTAWPRAASSAAVQRPSTPAPMTITSGEEATGDLIGRPQPECKRYSAAMVAARFASMRAVRAACWFQSAVGRRSPNWA